VVAQVCSRVVVMYGGLVMEEGSVEDIFYRPAGQAANLQWAINVDSPHPGAAARPADPGCKDAQGEVCSRVVVMYGGLVMEEGSVEDIFYRPAHPYTQGLLASLPRPLRAAFRKWTARRRVKQARRRTFNGR
jgi:ABC-type dipeptide/oligopeptide/nickel transport system ATPase component